MFTSQYRPWHALCGRCITPATIQFNHNGGNVTRCAKSIIKSPVNSNIQNGNLSNVRGTTCHSVSLRTLLCTAFLRTNDREFIGIAVAFCKWCDLCRRHLLALSIANQLSSLRKVRLEWFFFFVSSFFFSHSFGLLSKQNWF